MYGFTEFAKDCDSINLHAVRKIDDGRHQEWVAIPKDMAGTPLDRCHSYCTVIPRAEKVFFRCQSPFLERMSIMIRFSKLHTMVFTQLA